jgi:glycerol-3-phosphate dehydrogenase
MNRDDMLGRLHDHDGPWDMFVIGGGATGVGIALDAASRGYNVLLAEQSDFGKGSSSRSTKLIHGGVRYLQQGNIPLVMEALKERGILRHNAPHLVHDLAFIVPNYDWWETPFYGIGMKVYDLLAGKYGFGNSRLLSKEETLRRIPTLRTEGFRGGVMYHDGQFDDARLLIAMARTADAQRATLLNYFRVVALTKNSAGFLDGAICEDVETGAEHKISAKVILNASGPFSDAVRQLDDPQAAPMIAPSQGIHLVLDGSFLPGGSAIMVPRTSDGRVMFAIPWHGATLVGTTDTPIREPSLEPLPLPEEVDFILETAGQYLRKAPARSDVLSVFAGIRPLVKSVEGKNTAALSRDHNIHISSSGLLSVSGGKWTTYRKMAEDCVDQASTLAGLEARPCVTERLNIHGYHSNAAKFGELALYGADAPAVEELMRSESALGDKLHPAFEARAGEVVWSARYEMARTVDDFLARRSRALVLNARAAIEAAPRVAELLAKELGRDHQWQQTQKETFNSIAQNYVLSSTSNPAE